jgi:formate hydrogenlyase subunit 3/multisubunit Na+/H+ antiporter MnhD subunit
MPDWSAWLLLIVPVLIPLVAGFILWLIRERSIRAQWIIAVIAAFFGWILSLVYYPFLPIEASISVWLPADIFATPVQILLGSGNWPLLLSVQSVLLAGAILQLSRPIRREPATQIAAFLYIGAASLAVMAGNFLTIILVWTLFDISFFVLFTVSQDRANAIPQAIKRLAIDAAGTFLLLLATLALNEGRLGSATVPGASPGVGLLILIGAVLLRSGWYPSRLSPISSDTDSMHTETMLRLVPLAVAALPMFYFSAELDLIPLTFGIAVLLMLGMIYAAVRWLFQEQRLTELPNYNLAIIIYGILLWWMVEAESTSFISGVVTGILVGTVVAIGGFHERLHRLLLLTSGIFLLGFPVTSGGISATVIANSLADRQTFSMLLGPVLIVVLGMIGLGIIRIARQDLTAWPSATSQGRGVYALALASPLVASVIIGVGDPLSRTVYGLIIFVLTVAITAGLYFAATRLSEARYQQIRVRLAGTNFEGAGHIFVPVFSSFARGLRAIGGIFEGEGAMLWLFVILAVLAIALGEG